MAKDFTGDVSGSVSGSGVSGGNRHGGGRGTRGFRNQCVTVRFASGRTITGFFQGINDGLVRLLVAGSPVLVSLFTVEEISLAGPNAC